MKAVEVRELSKKFCRSLRYTLRYATLDISRSVFGLNRKTDTLRSGEFWALNGVSFDLDQGHRIGLIGRNGSGKSTLLKLLNGILLPDKGSITITGRIGALIEVGAGFHPLLTGRENIYINAAILGMKRTEVDKQFDAIVDFADIGDFLDSPVKFYSSGMYVRLGFSVAIHTDPAILLIDEVLAVGDFAFQKKCFDRLESVMAQGVTIIFVSHSMAAVQRLCPSTLLIDNGKVIFLGDSREAVARYYQLSQSATVGSDALSHPAIIHQGIGNMAVYITDFKVLDRNWEPVQRIMSGSFLRFMIEIAARDGGIERLPRIAIRVVDPKTDELLVNVQTPKKLIADIKLQKTLVLEFQVNSFNLAPGVYQLEVKIGGDGEDLHDYALISQLLELSWSKKIVDNMSYKGLVYLDGQWNIPTLNNREI